MEPQDGSMESGLMKSDTIIKELKEFERDGSWIHAHFESLRKKYPNQFLAVHDGRVVAHAKSVRALHAAIRRSDPGLIDRVAVEYLPKEAPSLIL